MKNIGDNYELKKMVGLEAAKLITNGMVCGIGTGSTVAFFIAELSRRIEKESLKVTGVSTSFQSRMLCHDYGIPLKDLQEYSELDLVIDGADEVDPELNLIKGGGAAQTCEKIVATMAKKYVIIVDETKLVPRLNHAFPVPVEVIPAALKYISIKIRSLGGEPTLRMGVRKDGPVITDNGQFIIDVQFKPGSDLRQLDRELHLMPGVVETGLFFDLATMVLVGTAAEKKVEKMVKAVDN